MPEETEQRASQAVGAGLRDDVDDAAPRAAVLGGVVGPVDLELLHRFLADGGPHAAAGVVCFAAVHGDAVAAAVAAVKRNAAVGRLLHAKAVGVGQGLRVGDARRQQSKRKIIAAVDGQIAHRQLVDGVGLLRALGLNQRRFPAYLHQFRRCADGKLHVNDRGLAHCNRNAFPGLRDEARVFRSNVVGARRQQDHAVLAAVVGEGLFHRAGTGAGDGDLRAGNHGPGRVGDRSPDLGRVLGLRRGHVSRKQRD